MGNCGGQTQKIQKQKSIKKIELNLHPKQQKLLKLIYADLSSRIKEKQLNKQTFLLFFHKNGLWGDRLFKQFDADSSQLISQKEFIRGIVKICKTSEQKKIGLLYKFLSAQSVNQQGISFKDFLKMLYNYPKKDLQTILNDQDFVNKEIKSHLIAIDSQFKGRRYESVCPADIKDLRLAKTKFKLEDSEKQSQRQQSKVGKDILKQISKKKQVSKTTLKITVDEKDVQIKTNSIHQLVKKFAKSIFKSYHISQKNGYLSYQNFKDWIMSHKNLYNDYYSGFHTQIWQTDKVDQLPEFIKKQTEIRSKSRYLTKSLKKVTLSLFHSILIVTEQQNQAQPFQLICLDGLSTDKIFDGNGNGICIKHRDKFYKEKKFYFLNQQTSDEWMEHLKYFKGSSINALYQIKHQIGRGKFSLVYEGIEKCTGETCALKVINKKELSKESLDLIAHESSIMSFLSHPLMINYKETINTNNSMYIITELVKGKDLFDFVRDLKFIIEEEAAYIFKQIIVGVRYLHSMEIVHRDLKPENVMVECDEITGQINKIRIIDFGFANYLTVLKQYDPSQLMAGTPNYIAPQLLTMSDFNEKIDNFAIGSMLYFALSGTQAFMADTVPQILQKTIQGSFTLHDKRWKKISFQAKDLISRLLDTQPSTRISLGEALNHSWFKQIAKKKKFDIIDQQ